MNISSNHVLVVKVAEKHLDGYYELNRTQWIIASNVSCLQSVEPIFKDDHTGKKIDLHSGILLRNNMFLHSRLCLEI